MKIKKGTGIIVSLDLQYIEDAWGVVKDVDMHNDVHGYKIGALLAERYGLPQIVKDLRSVTEKPLIYDKQKFGTDIPRMSADFLDLYAESGVDYVIAFPQAGIETLRTVKNKADELNMNLIIGGLMTHRGYLTTEGGYITLEAALKIYDDAATMGITDYVVPGNRPNETKQIRAIIETRLPKDTNVTYWAPGFVTQGGTLEDASDVFEDQEWKAIIGSGIYTKPEEERLYVVDEYASLLH